MSEETQRTTVRTYVPAYQKAEWADAAEELDMSQSEFLRTMVQAGRRTFDVPPRDPSDGDPAETDATPRVEAVETRILDALDDGPLSWEEIVATLTEDLERRADDCLQDLQERGRVRYSGRDGGYVLTDE